MRTFKKRFGMAVILLGILLGNVSLITSLLAGGAFAQVPIGPIEFPVSNAAGQQQYPSAAFDGTNFLMVWEDSRTGSFSGSDIYASRVSSTGGVIDPNGIPIVQAPGNQNQPVVAYGGGVYLIAWADDRNLSTTGSEVRVSRVRTDGTVLDPDGIILGPYHHDCSFGIAFNGSDFLVVWADVAGNRGARVSSSGLVRDPGGFPISRTPGSGWPSATYGAGVFLVSWDNNSEILGALVDTNGSVLNSQDIRISAPNGGINNTSYSVAFDGTNFMVVWDWYSSPLNTNVRGALVTPSGSVLNPGGFLITNAPGTQAAAVIDFDGTNYRVVWIDFDNRVGTWTVRTLRISQTGTILDPGGVAIVSESFLGGLAIAYGAGNHLVGWSDTRTDPLGDIYGRLIPSTIFQGDNIPPTTIATPSPTPNANGWNNTNVNITLASTDNVGGSGVKEIHYTINANPEIVVSGASTMINLTSEGITTIGYHAVDNAGNVELGHTLSVKIDKTPPTISFGSTTPPPNAAGWNNTNVSVPFTAADFLSGVAGTSFSSPLVLSAEGSAVTGTVTATDVAGNSVTFTSPAFKIDKTPPVISSSQLPAANGAGWNNTNVAISFSATDTLSGGVICTVTSITVSTEGANQTVSTTCTDTAGNNASSNRTVNIDKTPPVISVSLSFVPNPAGGSDPAIKVSFTCSDSLSGVASCPAPILVSNGTTLLQAVNATATDIAGNSITAGCSLLNQFIATVQAASGKTISVKKANQLISAANSLKLLLKCP